MCPINRSQTKLLKTRGWKGKQKKFTVFYLVHLTIAGRRTLTKYSTRKVTDSRIFIVQKKIRHTNSSVACT